MEARRFWRPAKEGSVKRSLVVFTAAAALAATAGVATARADTHNTPILEINALSSIVSQTLPDIPLRTHLLNDLHAAKHELHLHHPPNLAACLDMTDFYFL